MAPTGRRGWPGARTPGVADGLLVLTLVLVLARLLRPALTRLRQPPVMAEVLAGLVIGASGIGLAPAEGGLPWLANAAIVV